MKEEEEEEERGMGREGIFIPSQWPKVMAQKGRCLIGDKQQVRRTMLPQKVCCSTYVGRYVGR